MIPIVYLAYAYGISELILVFVKRSRTGTVKTRKDRGSFIFLWLMMILGLTGGFFLSKYDSGNPGNYFFAGFGLCFILAGLIIRWIAIIQLGKSFTVDVAITDVANLKTDGIYNRVRHPSYLGLLLVVTGFSITMNSILSVFVVVVPIFLAISYRINVEEKLLISEFGEKYIQFKATTKKIIPFIY
jgi:protein-S-isoprenylcysteine O-methyltransferase Ste14